MIRNNGQWTERSTVGYPACAIEFSWVFYLWLFLGQVIVWQKVQRDKKCCSVRQLFGYVNSLAQRHRGTQSWDIGCMILGQCLCLKHMRLSGLDFSSIEDIAQERVAKLCHCKVWSIGSGGLGTECYTSQMAKQLHFSSKWQRVGSDCLTFYMKRELWPCQSFC